MKKTAAFAGAKSPFATEEATNWREAWCRYWFAPRNAFGLHVMRVLVGLLFLAWLLPYAGQVEAFFGLDGWFDAQAYIEASKIPEEMRPFPAPGWSVLFPLGHNPAALQAIYWTALGIILLFTLGVGTRLTSVLTFVIVVSFTANPAISYDADRLLPVLAFYLALGYLLLGQSRRNLSLVERLFGMRGIFLFSPTRPEEEGRQESIGANIALRLFQVHFAFLVVMMGLDKLQVGDWWSGTAFWYWLYPPGTSLEVARTHRRDAYTYLTFMSVAVYATLAWQIAFPLFAWRRGWRLVLLGGAFLGWFGLAVFAGLPLFGPILVIGSLSYLTAAEWQRWFGFLGRLRLGSTQQTGASIGVRKETKETAAV
jgi:hypothetical protein